MPGLSLHTDNNPIRMLSEAEQLKIYVALMWSVRRRQGVLAIIKGRIDQINRLEPKPRPFRHRPV